MLAKSLRRLGSVVWLRPAPVTRAECRPSSSSAQAASSPIQVVGGVGERGEDDDLAVAGVDRLAALAAR